MQNFTYGGFKLCSMLWNLNGGELRDPREIPVLWDRAVLLVALLQQSWRVFAPLQEERVRVRACLSLWLPLQAGGNASVPVTFVPRLREGDTFWGAAPPIAIILL